MAQPAFGRRTRHLAPRPPCNRRLGTASKGVSAPGHHPRRWTATPRSPAFTGDISAEMGRHGARYVIAGHSAEYDGHAGTSPSPHAATRRCCMASSTPATGESLAERAAPDGFHWPRDDSPTPVGQTLVVIAYEPVWPSARPDAHDRPGRSPRHRYLAAIPWRRLGAAGSAIRLLYGGSVGPKCQGTDGCTGGRGPRWRQPAPARRRLRRASEDPMRRNCWRKADGVGRTPPTCFDASNLLGRPQNASARPSIAHRAGLPRCCTRGRRRAAAALAAARHGALATASRPPSSSPASP